MFRVRQKEAYSDLKQVTAGVPQGSVLGPILYLLYTCDIPREENATIATFADDAAILATGDNIEEATKKLKKATENISTWMKKWKIKLNKRKSVHVNFTSNKKDNYLPVSINNNLIPHSNTAKYRKLIYNFEKSMLLLYCKTTQ